MWPPRIPATMFLASAHPSHYIFQPSDFILYLGPSLGEVLKNQSVYSTHYIPDILIDYKLDFNATTIPRCYYIILLLYRLLSYLAYYCISLLLYLNALFSIYSLSYLFANYIRVTIPNNLWIYILYYVNRSYRNILKRLLLSY